MYTVTQTIQSTSIDNNAPVEVNYYKGDNLASAMGAMAQAVAAHAADPEWVRILSVRLDIS